MKQDKQGQVEVTNKRIELSEGIFNQIENVYKEIEEYDDRINIAERTTEKIKELRQQIKDIDEAREELISKVLGQLFNGVLVKDKLTCRRGKIYEYRRQYPTNIEKVKKIIEANLHEVTEKLTKSSLDILEFLLQKIYMKERQVVIKFPELKIIERTTPNSWKNNKSEVNYSLYRINGISIDDSGGLNFLYEYQDNEGNTKREFMSMQSETYAGLYIKFEKEIEEKTKKFIEQLESEVNNAEKEKLEIIEKGQNQLALCELTQGDVKGYGK